MSLDFQPKIDKIVELMLYLAHKVPGSDKYQVVKFIYLGDREHLVRYGRPIVQEVYYALDYGPVASKAKSLMERDRWVMNEAGLDDLPFAIGTKPLKHKSVETLGEPRRPVDFDLFSKSDVRVIDEILDKYGASTFDDLFKLTHGHFAYRNAWENKKPHSKRALMRYVDMIEDPKRRQAIVDDIGPVSRFME